MVTKSNIKDASKTKVSFKEDYNFDASKYPKDNEAII